MARKVKRKKEKDKCRIILSGFSTNIESLREFVDNLAPVVNKYDARVYRKAESTVKKLVAVIGKGGRVEAKKPSNLVIHFRDEVTEEEVEEKIGKIANIMKEMPRLRTANVELLYKSSFVMLISYFDFLIADLIHCYYEMYPESLVGNDLSIKLTELKPCNDLEEAMDIILNKRVDSVLYGNLESQKSYFKDDLRIDIKERIIDWGVINEGVERRNVIVHNDSTINKRYLRNVLPGGSTGRRKEFKEGERVGVTEEYFRRVYDEISVAGLILIESCWRKWIREDIENADKKLVNSMYEALIKEEWGIAERLGVFSKECEVSNPGNRLYLDINYCQSLKWQGKKAALDKELARFDVSTLSPIYVLALCALNDDRKGFYQNVEKVAALGEIEEESFSVWPLFRELRKDGDYTEKIRLAFSKKSEAVKNN